MRARRISPAHIMLVIIQSWPDGFDLSTGPCPGRCSDPCGPRRGTPKQWSSGGVREEPDLVKSGQNIPFGNKEEIRNFNIWDMKKCLQKCSRELFSPKSGVVVSFLLGTTGVCNTLPCT